MVLLFDLLWVGGFRIFSYEMVGLKSCHGGIVEEEPLACREQYVAKS